MQITKPNKLNATALHGAAAVGSADVVELLLSKGLHAHKHLLNRDKQTALEVAESRSNYSNEVKKSLPRLRALLELSDNQDSVPTDDVDTSAAENESDENVFADNEDGESDL